MSEKISGIIFLKFKEDANEVNIDEFINNTFEKNKDIIDGMEYNRFDSENTLSKVKGLIYNFCEKD